MMRIEPAPSSRGGSVSSAGTGIYGTNDRSACAISVIASTVA
jgi:hypothetical protein